METGAEESNLLLPIILKIEDRQIETESRLSEIDEKLDKLFGELEKIRELIAAPMEIEIRRR